MDEKTLNKALAKAFTRFEKRIDTRFDAKLTQALSEQTQDLRDFTRQEIKASENRVTEKITKRMDEGFDGQRQLILDAVAESMDYFVHPKINDHERRILKLEAKVA